MKLNKLQKRILTMLLLLCLITPAGIILPEYLHTGQAWGEWSARTMKDLIGYVPKGLSKYTELWHAPMTSYTLDTADGSVARQSGFYLVCGVFGATVSYVVMLLISKLIIRDER